MKFIELTNFDTEEGGKVLVNFSKVREVIKAEGCTEIYFSDEEYIYVKETYEEIKYILEVSCLTLTA